MESESFTENEVESYMKCCRALRHLLPELLDA